MSTSKVVEQTHMCMTIYFKRSNRSLGHNSDPIDRDYCKKCKNQYSDLSAHLMILVFSTLCVRCLALLYIHHTSIVIIFSIPKFTQNFTFSRVIILTAFDSKMTKNRTIFINSYFFIKVETLFIL